MLLLGRPDVGVISAGFASLSRVLIGIARTRLVDFVEASHDWLKYEGESHPAYDRSDHGLNEEPCCVATMGNRVENSEAEVKAGSEQREDRADSCSSGKA